MRSSKRRSKQNRLQFLAIPYGEEFQMGIARQANEVNQYDLLSSFLFEEGVALNAVQLLKSAF